MYNTCILLLLLYTGCSVTGGTSEKGVILHEKISRKYRIKIFHLRLCFRENRLWIFAKYGCIWSRLVITDLIVDHCLMIIDAKVLNEYVRAHLPAKLEKYLTEILHIFVPSINKMWINYSIFEYVTRWHVPWTLMINFSHSMVIIWCPMI